MNARTDETMIAYARSLEDLLLEVFPYIDTLADDPEYRNTFKPGVVRGLAERMRNQIERIESAKANAPA